MLLLGPGDGKPDCADPGDGMNWFDTAGLRPWDCIIMGDPPVGPMFPGVGFIYGGAGPRGCCPCIMGPDWPIMPLIFVFI